MAKKTAVLLDDADFLTQEATEESQPGVYPQEDGTVKVVLDVTLKKANGDEIAEITITRAPTVDELAKLKTDSARFDLMMLKDDAHMKLMPSITQPQITEGIFKKMSLFDQTNLMSGVASHFLPRPKRESKKG